MASFSFNFLFLSNWAWATEAVEATDEDRQFNNKTTNTTFNLMLVILMRHFNI